MSLATSAAHGLFQVNKYFTFAEDQCWSYVDTLEDVPHTLCINVGRFAER